MQYFDTLRSDVYDVTAYINPTMMQFNIQQTQKKMKENFFKQKRMFMMYIYTKNFSIRHHVMTLSHVKNR